MENNLTQRNLALKVVIGLAVLGIVMVLCGLVGGQKISLGRVFAGPGDEVGALPRHEVPLLRLVDGERHSEKPEERTSRDVQLEPRVYCEEACGEFASATHPKR